MRKWPAKRPRRTAKQRAQEQWFRQANKLYPYLSIGQQMAAREATKGTPLMPRDIFLAATSGRLYSIHYVNPPRKVYPVTARNEVSESLDVIGQVPGDIMVRGDEWWGRLPSGSAGDVLTAQGGTSPPVWAPASGGGGGGWSLLTSTTIPDNLQSPNWLDLNVNVDYQRLMLQIWGNANGGDFVPILRLNADNGEDYMWADLGGEDTESTHDDEWWRLWRTGGLATGRQWYLELIFPRTPGAPFAPGWMYGINSDGQAVNASFMKLALDGGNRITQINLSALEGFFVEGWQVRVWGLGTGS